MPELPDVEGFRRYVNATSLHQTISDVTASDERIVNEVSAAALRDHLKGAGLDRTTRHGKYLFVGVSRGGELVLHFGMTGTLEYHERSEEMPEHTRFSLLFETERRLSYINVRRLGLVTFTDNHSGFIQERELGPDALDEGLDRDTFIKAFKSRRAAVKSTLMNQSVVAGIGNVYSDEILFQAGVDPRAKANDLSEDVLGEVYGVMRRVMRTAAEHGGKPEELPDEWLLPHVQREEETCPRCGGAIQKVTVSGRTAHYCAACQKRGDVLL